jgi:hypothetical protein
MFSFVLSAIQTLFHEKTSSCMILQGQDRSLHTESLPLTMLLRNSFLAGCIRWKKVSTWNLPNTFLTEFFFRRNLPEKLAGRSIHAEQFV